MTLGTLDTLHRQYTAGNTVDDVLDYSAKISAKGLNVIISSLGEKSGSIEEATHKVDTYCNLLHSVGSMNATISVKPSDIGIVLAQDFVEENMERILRIAQETGKIVEIDLEFRPLLEPILALCRTMIGRGYDLRIAMQSVLSSCRRYSKL